MVLIKNRLGQFYFEGGVQKVRHHHSSHATKNNNRYCSLFSFGGVIDFIFFSFLPKSVLGSLLFIEYAWALSRDNRKFYQILQASLKGPSQFRRRVTWLENIPSSVNYLLATTAVVEYIGTFLERRYHGNIKQKDANQ